MDATVHEIVAGENMNNAKKIVDENTNNGEIIDPPFKTPLSCYRTKQ